MHCKLHCVLVHTPNLKIVPLPKNSPACNENNDALILFYFFVSKLIYFLPAGEKFREVLTITFGLNRCISGCSSAHQRNIEMTEVTSVAACKNIPNGEEKAQELIRSLHKEETLV